MSINVPMMRIADAFGSIADTIAQLNPQEVVLLKAPPEMTARVNELVFKKKEGGLSNEESAELNRFLTLDLFISLTKARARSIINA